MSKENVVVLGGGLCGTAFAKELSAKLDHSKYNLIVVEARTRLIWMLGGARMAVTDEGAPDKYFFAYDKFFPEGKGTVKNAKVEKIVPNSDGNGGALELAGGETLPYRSTSIQLRRSRVSDVSSLPQFSCWPLDPSGKDPSTTQRATLI